MNIVKMKDIELTEENAPQLTPAQREIFNTKFRGKYVYCINQTYCVAIEDMTEDQYRSLSDQLTAKTCCVYWKNYNGAILSSAVIDAGDIPVSPFPEHTPPYRPSDEQFDYVFTGWSPEPTVVGTGEVSYVAQFEAVAKPVEIHVTIDGEPVVLSDDKTYGELYEHLYVQDTFDSGEGETASTYEVNEHIMESIPTEGDAYWTYCVDVYVQPEPESSDVVLWEGSETLAWNSAAMQTDEVAATLEEGDQLVVTVSDTGSSEWPKVFLVDETGWQRVSEEILLNEIEEFPTDVTFTLSAEHVEAFSHGFGIGGDGITVTKFVHKKHEINEEA